VNLYGFVENDGLNYRDVLGYFATEQEAIDSAKEQIGQAARNSRLNGVKQLQQALKYLSRDADRDILTADAALYAIGESTFSGVAGVEYGATVYCKMDADSNDRFGIVGPERGKIPNRTEFLIEHKRGSVAVLLAPTGTTKTADLHTHTMAIENYFHSSGLSSTNGDDGILSPDNGLPSDDDSHFGLNGQGQSLYRRFIVHENPVAITYSLYEY